MNDKEDLQKISIGMLSGTCHFLNTIKGQDETMKKELFKNVMRLFGYIVCFIILYCFFNNYREVTQNSIFLMINMIQYVSLILIILITVFIVVSSFIWFEIKAFKKQKEKIEKLNKWLKKKKWNVFLL